VCAFLYASASLIKLPIVSLIVMCYFFIYIFVSGRYSRRLFLVLPAVAFIVPVLIVNLEYRGTSAGTFSASSGAILKRTFYGPADSLYYYFAFIPAYHDYLHGNSIQKLTWLTGGEYYDVARQTSLFINPRGLASGSNNAAYLGYLHADFGAIGIVAGSFLLGILIQSTEIFVCTRPKTLLNMACYAFLLYAFTLVDASSLPTVLLSDGVLVALTLVALSVRPVPRRRPAVHTRTLAPVPSWRIGADGSAAHLESS
jgi:hypothetical protein